jgi:hypothetical protein
LFWQFKANTTEGFAGYEKAKSGQTRFNWLSLLVERKSIIKPLKVKNSLILLYTRQLTNNAT